MKFGLPLGYVLGLVMFVCDSVLFRSVRNKVLQSVRGDLVWFVVRS